MDESGNTIFSRERESDIMFIYVIEKEIQLQKYGLYFVNNNNRAVDVTFTLKNIYP